jgi:hypothetical protein
MIQTANNQVLQRRRARRDGWTKKARQQFLDELAASANVAAALRVVGLSKSSAYRLRHHDAAFGALWDAARETAYGRLKDELLARAMGEVVADDRVNPDGPSAAPTSADAQPFDTRLAMTLLQEEKRTVEKGRTGRMIYKQLLPEEVDAALARALDGLERRLARQGLVVAQGMWRAVVPREE